MSDHDSTKQPASEEEDSHAGQTVDGMRFMDRDTEVLCPSCQKPLHIGILDHHKVAGCETCHGILVQSAAFSEIVSARRADFQGTDAKPEPLKPSELSIQRECPSCGAQMDTHPYHGPGSVVIDSCAPCGLIWLDNAELYQIVIAPGQR